MSDPMFTAGAVDDLLTMMEERCRSGRLLLALGRNAASHADAMTNAAADPGTPAAAGRIGGVEVEVDGQTEAMLAANRSAEQAQKNFELAGACVKQVLQMAHSLAVHTGQAGEAE